MNKCEICDGKTEDKLVSVTFERYGQKFVYQNIKARVCRNCGEEFLDGPTVTDIEREIRERVFEKAA
ncbi:MAG: YgiT-type zinc finger protein [Pyrinomonadaceae bacterium]|nr:YgiT-type zinc finger protein [Pyrinomonadaceae bacterium]